MAKIVIDIQSCNECPFSESRRHYTGDSFEIEFDWSCGKWDSKSIANSVSWGREKTDLAVPEWCPLLKKD